MALTSTMLLRQHHGARLGPQALALAGAAELLAEVALPYHWRVTSELVSCMRFLMVLTTPAKRMAHDPPPCLPFQVTFMRFSPAPYSSTSRWRGVRLFHGLSSGMPNSRETAAATLAVQPWSLRCDRPTARSRRR